MFIDETGDHGLASANKDFPIFLLCGVIISEDEYKKLDNSFNNIKSTFWGNTDVVFHSSKIRKCDKDFSILFDLDIKSKFYNDLNSSIANHGYTIIAAGIRKEEYIKKVGMVSNDVYALCLSFIMERAVFYLDKIIGDNKLYLIIEERGAKEDKKLEEHFQRLIAKGTGYVTPQRFNKYEMTINFRKKRQNINGLQLSDLVAYPIAIKCLYKERQNIPYDLILPKIYSNNKLLYGLKVFPEK